MKLLGKKNSKNTRSVAELIGKKQANASSTTQSGEFDDKKIKKIIVMLVVLLVVVLGALLAKLFLFNNTEVIEEIIETEVTQQPTTEVVVKDQTDSQAVELGETIKATDSAATATPVESEIAATDNQIPAEIQATPPNTLPITQTNAQQASASNKTDNKTVDTKPLTEADFLKESQSKIYREHSTDTKK